MNIYTPQPRMTQVRDLLTIPVDKNNLDADSSEIQLLGNVAKLSVIGTPGIVSHSNIRPIFDIYVSAEGRDLGGVLEDVNPSPGEGLAHHIGVEQHRGDEAARVLAAQPRQIGRGISGIRFWKCQATIGCQAFKQNFAECARGHAAAGADVTQRNVPLSGGVGRTK